MLPRYLLVEHEQYSLTQSVRIRGLDLLLSKVWDSWQGVLWSCSRHLGTLLHLAAAARRDSGLRTGGPGKGSGCSETSSGLEPGATVGCHQLDGALGLVQVFVSRGLWGRGQS